MPAVMRDAPRRQPKPRTAAGAGRARAQVQAPPKGASRDEPKFHTVGPAIRPRLVLAVAGVLMAGGVALALAGGRAHGLERAAAESAARGLAAVGFSVKAVEIEGGTTFSAPYILSAAAVERGQPILSLDLDAIRQRVEKVGWVKSVRILRLLPDTLVIAVSERPRLAVWQSGGRSYVVDPQGQIIPEADPGLFVDLPLVVGDGANEAAAAILPQITTRPRLMSRLEALVRVDGRRWDLRLKDGSLIQLPAEGEDSALIQLDQLDQKNRLFELGFERIDLRDPDMIAVRPRQAPAAQPALAPTAASRPVAPAPATATTLSPPPPSAAPPRAPSASGE